MNIRRHLLPFASRLRLPAAFLCAFAALLMLWSGLGLPALSFPGNAMADASHGNGRASALALLPEDRVMLLQSTVDSVALSLGGVLSGEDDPESKRRALTGALSALTFSLGGDAYFTAWQGTRIVHSPLNADASGLDFGASVDGRGAPFVQGMDALAEEGGFMRVLLPPQRHAVPAAASVRLSIDEASGNPEAGGLFPAAPALCPLEPGASCRDARPEDGNVDQVVYIRRIPHSQWHIAAFLPIREAESPQPLSASGEAAFSSVWGSADNEALAFREGRFRKGLRVSGLSLGGLAGLMLFSGGPLFTRPRKDEDANDVP